MEPLLPNKKDSQTIKKLLEAMELSAPPVASDLRILVERHGPGLPADYLEFISKHDGANGEVGDKYLSIYTIADVLGVAEAKADTPDNQFLIVASTGYFHYGLRAGVFYELDLMDDSYQVAMGTYFAEFLQQFDARTWDED
jgi:hypothetical protein